MNLKLGGIPKLDKTKANDKDFKSTFRKEFNDNLRY